MTIKPKVLIIDQRRVIGLIRSTAYIVSANQFTNIKIVEGENFIEKAFNGLTGNVLMEIESDDQKINETTRERTKLFVKRLKDAAKHGPGKMIEFLQELENTKQKFNQYLQEKYSEVTRNNQELINDLEKAIKITAAIKATSTTIVSIGSLFTPAGSAISFAQSIGMEIATNIGEAKNADAIFFQKTGLGVTKVSVQSAYDTILEKEITMVFDDITKWALNEQYKLYKPLKDVLQATPAEAFKITKAIKPGVSATRTAANQMGSGGFKIFGKQVPGVSMVFAGKAVFDAWKEYADTVNGL